MSPTILITGAAGYWGARLAEQLAAHAGLRVLGLDRKPLKQEIEGLDFIRADLRSPLIQDLLEADRVDTVVHLDFTLRARHDEKTFERNVLTAIKFFGMCAQAGVRRIILKSSTAVYGAHPANSLFLPETHPLNGSRSYGYTRCQVELESFCNGFARQHAGTALTILRFPSIVGPTADTPMTRFLTDPRAPILLGFNPLMQIIHEDDVVAALAHAALHDLPGIFNIAAEDALPLNKLIILAGKIPIPILHPLAYAAAARSPKHAPIQLDYLRYPWVAGLQKMRDDFGLTPAYTAEETLRAFAAATRLMRYVPDPLARVYEESPLKDIVERRRKKDDDDEFSFDDDDEDLTDYD